MFYIRLTFPPLDVFEILEPLLDDYRKLRFRSMDGSYSILTIDEYADQLLNEERVCDIQLPRLTQRRILEEVEGLGKRRSKLGLAIGMGADSDEESEGYQSDDVQGRGHTDSEEEDDDGVEGDQRYISRSPTPASDDDQPSRPRFVSRSPSPAEEEDSGRYVSRSPTPEQD